MNPATTAAVVIVTMASTLSYAQPATPPERQLNYVQVANPSATQSAFVRAGEEGKTMILRPKSPVEFAKNLNAIFDQNALLEDNFYTENKLKEIFDLDEIRITSDDIGAEHHTSIRANVSESVFPIIKTREFLGGLISPAELMGEKAIDQSGSIKATIYFSMKKGGPNFDLTQKIFGKEFSHILPKPTPDGGPPMPAIPHAFEAWQYKEFGYHTIQTLTIRFNDEGELALIMIDIYKK
ncbi:hypothetical protein [Paraburkholderia solisilvae]|uniref:Uncharacterized protein n=1 Tax=Paraburkholderia solisilvae TaxID=624376 RepID=A0A6J5DYC1_9BURK|nr:hypothetical protein [Paraburkholderia solisilvae]CAB3759023.1 hypothetical protein LMG29739_03056 [Paraburkholderia solisilvae]